MKIAIRVGTPDDLAAIQTCVHEAYLAYVPVLGKPPAAMVTDFLPLILAGQVHVLDLDGEVIGTVTLKPDRTYLEISILAVLPRFQNRGWGLHLMAYAENYARELGLSEARLYTNEKLDHLVRYYQKLGFIETTRMRDGGYQRVFMSKSLVDKPPREAERIAWNEKAKS